MTKITAINIVEKKNTFDIYLFSKVDLKDCNMKVLGEILFNKQKF